MSKRAIQVLWWFTFAACLAPAALLGLRALHGQLGADPVQEIQHFTGDWTLRLLLACLAVTPIRRLTPRLSWLIRLRKLLGNYAFFYASLHLLTWIVLFSGLDWHAMLADVVKRRFITVGMLAWAILSALAATSSAWAVRKLGGKRWQALHRLVYVAAIAGVVHYWWLVKPGVRTPMNDTAVLTLLLLARIIWHVARRGPKQAATRQASATV
jgi:methionine sulfoxide reductase heme-binding subunit